jgi:hypothetical protein
LLGALRRKIMSVAFYGIVSLWEARKKNEGTTLSFGRFIPRVVILGCYRDVKLQNMESYLHLLKEGG